MANPNRVAVNHPVHYCHGCPDFLVHSRRRGIEQRLDRAHSKPDADQHHNPGHDQRRHGVRLQEETQARIPPGELDP